VVSLRGLFASEPAVRAHAAGSRVLHLATHGFFLGGDCAADDRPAGAPALNEDPLLLSGIALAGANRRGLADPAEDDGILTAREIAGLDLRGVDWVVLSGCDTGLGALREGEGVLGLRRAFAIAGARTVVMSLWPVEDEEARRFMAELYVNRLERNQDTVDSVTGAALASMLRLRRTVGAAPPALWAPFVAVGSWR
jgi:CHAT domain-containing protein